MNYLPEIKKVLNLIISETDDLKRLERRVNEIVIEDMMKDCILHSAYKQTTETMYIFEVEKDDYDHITENINLVQKSLLPDITVMACSTDDNYRILFSIYERD